MAKRILFIADTVLYMLGLGENPNHSFHHPEGITRDWQMVGHDMSNAIDRYSHEEAR